MIANARAGLMPVAAAAAVGAILLLSLSLADARGGATPPADARRTADPATSVVPGDPCGTGFPAPQILSTEIHEGDLVLSGNDTLTIENKEYVVKGTVYLSGNARLTIRNSDFEVQHYPRQEIFASGQATLEAENTTFTGFIHSQFWDQSTLTMNRAFLTNLINVNDQAQADIDGSCISRKRAGSVQAGGQAQAHIRDSVVGAIGITPFLGPGLPVDIDGLESGYFERWSAREEISSNLTYDVVLERTEIKENPGPGGAEMGWNISTSSDAELTVSNSTLNKIVISFDGEDVQFSGLVTGEPVDFDYQSIHLRNTDVRGQWGIHVSHGETRIDDSDGVWLWPVGSEDTFITNTAIDEFDPRQYTGTIYLNNSSMTDGFEIFENSVFRMEGSVRMLGIGPLFTADSRMTRNYEVVLLDGSDGSPMPGVELQLAKDGAEVWSGTTDSEGRASFDITFDINNNQDAWTLTTSNPSIALSKQVSIYSDTPVMVNLEPRDDGGGLWPVAYADCGQAGPGDGTVQSPFRTVQEGVDSVAGAGLVRVAPGTCQETVTLGDDVVVEGAGPDATTIEGDVFAQDVIGAWVRGVTVSDDNTAGIHCYDSSLTITNVVVRSQPHSGVYSSNCDLTARNNTLVGNGHAGITLIDSSQAVVENNIFAGNGQYGLTRDVGSVASSDYNDFWQNAQGAYGPGLTGGPHDIFANPLFVAPDDFRLRPGSPAVDAGNPASDYNDSNGSRNDMGAFGGPYYQGGLPGDTDCDGDADAIDALFILRAVATLPPFAPCTVLAGDVNCDGLINSVDSLAILRHVAGLLVTLPPGCPAIGGQAAELRQAVPSAASR